MNKIPEVNIDSVGKLKTGNANPISSQYKNYAANLKAPTSDRNVVTLSKVDELLSIPDSFNAANKWAYNGTMAGSEKLDGLVDKAKGLVGLGKDD